MLILIIVVALTIAFFSFLAFSRARVNELKDRVFQFSEMELRNIQKEIEGSDLSSEEAQIEFNQRADKILKMASLQAYGGEDDLPMKKYIAFKDQTADLRQKLSHHSKSLNKTTESKTTAEHPDASSKPAPKYLAS